MQIKAVLTSTVCVVILPSQFPNNFLYKFWSLTLNDVLKSLFKNLFILKGKKSVLRFAKCYS